MFGVSKSEETNTALDKAAAVLDSVCARTKLVLQSCGGPFFNHRAIAASLPPSFNLNFGTYSLSLTIIISTVFKRLGLQIHWYSNNELRH